MQLNIWLRSPGGHPRVSAGLALVMCTNQSRQNSGAEKRRFPLKCARNYLGFGTVCSLHTQHSGDGIVTTVGPDTPCSLPRTSGTPVAQPNHDPPIFM